MSIIEYVTSYNICRWNWPTDDVQVAEIDLHEAGFDTTWEDIAVPSGLHGSAQWEGTRRPYWTIDVYKLPVNTFVK